MRPSSASAAEHREVDVSISRSLAIDYEFFQIRENLEGQIVERSVYNRRIKHFRFDDAVFGDDWVEDENQQPYYDRCLEKCEYESKQAVEPAERRQTQCLGDNLADRSEQENGDDHGDGKGGNVYDLLICMYEAVQPFSDDN